MAKIKQKWARKGGNSERKARLIRVGADSNSKNNIGQQSPLFNAGRYEYLPVGDYEFLGLNP